MTLTIRRMGACVDLSCWRGKSPRVISPAEARAMQIVLPGVFFTKCLKSVIPAHAGLHGRRTHPVWHSCVAKALGRPPRTVCSGRTHPGPCRKSLNAESFAGLATTDQLNEVLRSNARSPKQVETILHRARQAGVEHDERTYVTRQRMPSAPPAPLGPFLAVAVAVAHNRLLSSRCRVGTIHACTCEWHAVAGCLRARYSEYALPRVRRSQPRDPRF